MDSRRYFMLLCSLSAPLLMGQMCGAPLAAPDLVPRRPSPLPAGIFTGLMTFEVYAAGDSIQGLQKETIHISDNGLPIEEGAEISVGRTITLQGLQETFTRIEAIEGRLLVHFDFSGQWGDWNVSGYGTKAYRPLSNDSIEVLLTLYMIDTSLGFAIEGHATGTLTRW